MGSSRMRMSVSVTFPQVRGVTLLGSSPTRPTEGQNRLPRLTSTHSWAPAPAGAFLLPPRPLARPRYRLLRVLIRFFRVLWRVSLMIHVIS